MGRKAAQLWKESRVMIKCWRTAEQTRQRTYEHIEKNIELYIEIIERHIRDAAFQGKLSTTVDIAAKKLRGEAIYFIKLILESGGFTVKISDYYDEQCSEDFYKIRICW